MRVAILDIFMGILALGHTQDSSSSSISGALSERENIAEGTELRILPFGDSNTVRVQSSDNEQVPH